MLDVRIYPSRVSPTEFVYQVQINKLQNCDRHFTPIFRIVGSDINSGLDILGEAHEAARQLFGCQTFVIELVTMTEKRERYFIIAEGALDVEPHEMKPYWRGKLINNF